MLSTMLEQRGGREMQQSSDVFFANGVERCRTRMRTKYGLFGFRAPTTTLHWNC